MYGWRGFVSGVLVLIIGGALVQNATTEVQAGVPAGARRIDTVLGFFNQAAVRFIDPTVPAIPARTKAPLAPPAGAVHVTGAAAIGPPSSGTGQGGGFAPGGGGSGGGGGGSGY